MLTALTAAAVAAWLAGPAGAAAITLTAASLAALAAGTAAAALLRRRERGAVLRFDGQCWAVDDPVVGSVTGLAEPVIDVGGWLLVRFEPEGGGRARWLAPTPGPGLHPLRVALYNADRAAPVRRPASPRTPG